jgi:hypothetical protein
MKRRFILLTTILLFLFLVNTGWSEVKFSAGGFGGVNFPIVQEDSEIAGIAGCKIRATFQPFLAVEPNFTYIRQGGITLDVDGVDMDRDGGDLYSIGADMVLGSFDSVEEFYWYFIFGLYSNGMRREGREDLNKFGFNLGFGLEILPTDVLGVDFRTKLQIITIEGGSRKNILVTGGLNYYFGGFGF